MAVEENPTEVEQILEGSEGQTTTENTPDEGGEVSSTTQVEDWKSEAASIREQLTRQDERNRYLEQSNLLLQENARRQNAPVPTEVGLSPELTELDRTLDPLFSKRLKSQLDPMSNNVAAALDGNDALRFEMYLMRQNPDLLSDEEALARTFQQVEQVRQQAAQVYGKYLSRTDAYLYSQGLEGVKEKAKSRTSKKVNQVKEEAKRQLQVQSAQGGDNKPDAKRAGNEASIDSIRRKMNAGDKVTPAEKEAFRKHLANAQF